jgi:hypothetical protein
VKKAGDDIDHQSDHDGAKEIGKQGMPERNSSPAGVM